MDERRLLRDLNDHVRRAQRVLAEYLPDDSAKTEKETISELLGILDGRELHRIQEQLRAKPALFQS